MRKRPARTNAPRTHLRVAAAMLGVATAGGALVLAPGTASAIAAGTTVTDGDLSFVAEVSHISGGLCTGTLIDPQWVLTASHCAEGAPAEQYSVRVGNTSRGTGGQTRAVTEIHNHPDYVGGHNDVALLRLDSPITDIAPVALAKPADAHLWDGSQAGPFTQFDQGTSVGWGTDAAGGFPGTLQMRIVDITPAEIDGAGIKTIPVSGGPCPGDSGGPLLITVGGQQVQAGILKGANCSTSGSYSEVGAGGNRQFILSVLPHLGDTQGSWQARHNLTAEQYQSEFDTLVAQGYRLVDVSAYTVGGEPRFTGIWTVGGSGAWQARHGMTSEQYQAEFDRLLGQGYRLLDVAGYSVGGQARYAAIWDQSGGAWQARHGLSAAQYQAEFNTIVAQGYRPVRVSAYEVGGQAQFAAIFESSPGGWEARHGLSAREYQATFDQLVAQGYQLLDVSGYTDGGQERYAAIWDTNGTGAWQARHGLSAAQYQEQFDSLLGQGYQLNRVAGYAVGGEARFAAVWTA